MDIDYVLKLIILNLVSKGGVFGAFYTLHQIYIKLSYSLISLTQILSDLLESGYILNESDKNLPGKYTITEVGKQFLKKQKLTGLHFNFLEANGLQELLFIKGLIKGS